jgi:hypothetical protein
MLCFCFENLIICEVERSNFCGKKLAFYASVDRI